VSEKCDVYSLGLLLWECLARSGPPFSDLAPPNRAEGLYKVRVDNFGLVSHANCSCEGPNKVRHTLWSRPVALLSQAVTCSGACALRQEHMQRGDVP
jgi:hypothetical protein